MSIVVLGTLIQFHPLGPHGVWPRLIHGVLVASALVVGMCWIVLPWPRRRVAIAFVWWADISMVVGACTLSAPASRLGALAHMGLIGVFAAFLLGWRVLAVHCVFATVAIFGLMGWNARLGEATWFDQYVYSAPALSSVVLLPIIIQVVIEGGRRSLKAISLAAHQDPLTGLLNRRGVQVALGSLLSGQRATRIVAVVLVDVDELKELNDRLGHDAGDESIRAVAAMLATATRASDLTARMGGDEFMVVASSTMPMRRQASSNVSVPSDSASVHTGPASVSDLPCDPPAWPASTSSRCAGRRMRSCGEQRSSAAMAFMRFPSADSSRARWPSRTCGHRIRPRRELTRRRVPNRTGPPAPGR